MIKKNIIILYIFLTLTVFLSSCTSQGNTSDSIEEKPSIKIYLRTNHSTDFVNKALVKRMENKVTLFLNE